MTKERLVLQIDTYINKIRSDYQNNIITGFQYEMLYRELSNLIKNSDSTDTIITACKLDMLKTVYIIMK